MNGVGIDGSWVAIGGEWGLGIVVGLVVGSVVTVVRDCSGFVVICN
jgi:hypothetical protein